MSTQLSSPTPLAFGPFEVNAHTGELRKHGKPVRLSGQPFQILLLLVAKPGDLVTREELREQLWTDGTFVDFDHGLNAAINKLRRALGDSADHPRYIETVPGRGYRFIGILDRESKLFPRRANHASSRGSASCPGSKGFAGPGCRRRASQSHFVLASRSDDASPRQSPWTLTRLTADSGISDDPALSPDGRLVAYSSDPSRWSDRRSVGGRARSLRQARCGRIADPFDVRWRGQQDARFLARRQSDRVPVEPGWWRHLRDARARRRCAVDRQRWLQSAFFSGRIAGGVLGWSPERCHLGAGERRRLGGSSGRRTAAAGRPELYNGPLSDLAQGWKASVDVWDTHPPRHSTARASTGGWLRPMAPALYEPAPTTRSSMLVCSRSATRRTPVPAVPEPRCWSSPGDKVTFSIPAGDSWNLWEIELSPQTGKVVGQPAEADDWRGERLACILRVRRRPGLRKGRNPA